MDDIEIGDIMVDHLVPEEGDIEWVVKGLRNNRSGGASRMRAEHIKRWIAAARRAEKEESTAEGEKMATATETGGPEDPAIQEGADNWTRFVDLVQTALREGDLAEEAMWQAVFLIPEGKKDYRGIGLV